MKTILKKIKNKYDIGNQLLSNEFYVVADQKNSQEIIKIPSRTDVIKHLINYLNRETKYLEIGVRYTEANFDKIDSHFKVSVDPGFENEMNPVDFKMTSDAFFDSIRNGVILDKAIKFDVIFIDGLHLAEQVERDISNSLAYLKEDGFIVLHDCNPPTEYHARETYSYAMSPAKGYWNGTTWKAFFKFRQNESYYSCCIDSDWGIGIISPKINLGKPTPIKNDYFEYKIFESHRKESLNLISFEDFKSKLV